MNTALSEMVPIMINLKILLLTTLLTNTWHSSSFLLSKGHAEQSCGYHSKELSPHYAQLSVRRRVCSALL
jgi:hypothetical protein